MEELRTNYAVEGDLSSDIGYLCDDAREHVGRISEVVRAAAFDLKGGWVMNETISVDSYRLLP